MTAAVSGSGIGASKEAAVEEKKIIRDRNWTGGERTDDGPGRPHFAGKPGDHRLYGIRGLVKEFYPQAEFLTTPMRQEKERCEMALKAAQDGRKTAMICSGDSGVYGMAGWCCRWQRRTRM